MYEVRRAAGKGLGVFATRNIARGTRIVAEKPKFTVASDRDIYPALRELSIKDRAYIAQLSTNPAIKPSLLSWFEPLSHVYRSGGDRSLAVGEYKRLLAAFRNNSFNIGNETRAIFHDISRINHSCLPNAQGNFNPSIASFTIHAVKPIDANDEISISYLDEHGALKLTRQARLQQDYGFECRCAACDTSTTRGMEGERRRKAFQSKLKAFVDNRAQRKERDLKGELEMLQMLIRLFEQEGLAGRELASMYLSAAEGCSQIGDVSAAKEYGRQGLLMDEESVGSDNPLYKGSVARMRKINAHLNV